MVFKLPSERGLIKKKKKNTKNQHTQYVITSDNAKIMP